MTNATLSLNTDSIHYQVRKTAAELYARAENLRLIAAALADRVGELSATAGPEALRQVAAIVKTHSAGVLASTAALANKAERLECIADIREACGPVPSEDREE